MAVARLIWSNSGPLFWTSSGPFLEQWVIHVCSWIEWFSPGPLELKILKFLASSNQIIPGDHPRIEKIKSGCSLDHIRSFESRDQNSLNLRTFHLGSLRYMYLRSGKIRMIIPSLSNFDYTQNKVKQTLLYFC